MIKSGSGQKIGWVKQVGGRGGVVEGAACDIVYHPQSFIFEIDIPKPLKC